MMKETNTRIVVKSDLVAVGHKKEMLASNYSTLKIGESKEDQ